MAAPGGHAVQWQGLFSKVSIPAGLSPIIAALVATTGTFLVHRLSRDPSDRARSHGFRIGQMAHGCGHSSPRRMAFWKSRIGSVRPIETVPPVHRCSRAP